MGKKICFSSHNGPEYYFLYDTNLEASFYMCVFVCQHRHMYGPDGRFPYVAGIIFIGVK